MSRGREGWHEGSQGWLSPGGMGSVASLGVKTAGHSHRPRNRSSRNGGCCRELVSAAVSLPRL